MAEYVPLESLVSDDKLSRVDNIEKHGAEVTEVLVRNVKCCFATESRRTLWQGVGLEHIEPDLLDFIDKIELGSVFFDIGASNGIFSIYAANKGLNVYAFEPEIQNFGLLGKNVFLNNNSLGTLHSFNIALSDQTRQGQMFIANYEAGGHMKILDTPQLVGSDSKFEPAFIQNSLCYKLDDFIALFSIPSPNYIKIDVDGSEYQTLCGMEAVLDTGSVHSLFIEVDDTSSSAKDIHNFIMSKGFQSISKTQVQNYQGLNNYVYTR
ncbi:FkbM family methyltransferase [Paraglaciecola arctica]|uniref:Methyltransferase FkbM domain-containing protein n=1 Tax=Paraglaciecola arctica BSs20135 TaxID=493475 RepID=K6YT96_9ALTE|nr:FkbM family methyltransferase [Paraglaciecola arctica]GAC19923.1 hypothetical protein GARC_2960 [Paraglaciecola arctica BSs20135]